MKKSNLLFIVFIGLCIFLGTSCSTSQQISSTELNAVKNMEVPEGKALVYILRPAAMGFAIGMRITCNDKEIGKTHGKQFIYTTLDPGNYMLVSHAENKAELPIQVEAGQKYYIEQQVKMGIVMARSKLVRIEETAAKTKLQKCKLAK